eukprot:Nk52_evm4s326 gene=Nk52_evmTU4s326
MLNWSTSSFSALSLSLRGSFAFLRHTRRLLSASQNEGLRAVRDQSASRGPVVVNREGGGAEIRHCRYFYRHVGGLQGNGVDDGTVEGLGKGGKSDAVGGVEFDKDRVRRLKLWEEQWRVQKQMEKDTMKGKDREESIVINVVTKKAVGGKVSGSTEPILSLQGTRNVTTPLMLLSGESNDNVKRRGIRKLLQKGEGKKGDDPVVACRVNGVLWDLQRPIEEENEVEMEFVTASSSEGETVVAHSSAHILGCALERAYPGTKLADGPPLEEGGGFFYEGMVPGWVEGGANQKTKKRKNVDAQESAGDAESENGKGVLGGGLEKLEEICDSLLAKKDTSFECMKVPVEFAEQMFEDNVFKLHYLKRIKESGETFVTLYKFDDFIDLCRGPHLVSPDIVKAISLNKATDAPAAMINELERNGGDDASVDAKWSKSVMLKRIYGMPFLSKQKQAEWLSHQDELKERDHRLIGRKQGLFMMHKYSPGSPFFLPHGMRIFNGLVEYIRNEYRVFGYDEVSSPLVYDKALFEQSGHWEHYAENIYNVVEGEKSSGKDEGVMSLKPMNCPGHCLIYAHKPKTYRELPLRIADFSALHRNEASGALTGLTRVRRFHQDDAHIFCLPSQVKSEISSCLAMIDSLYRYFGFQTSHLLSTRPDSFMGLKDQWDKAEQALKSILDERSCEGVGEVSSYGIAEGDGAFYGPKIDVYVKDSLARSHQVATVQLDFQLPERFDLEYVTDKGTKERPVMVHRAALGSLERFIAVAAEQCKGKWPLWVSPRQVLVIPVDSTDEEMVTHCKSMVDKLKMTIRYVDLDASSNSMVYRVRKGQELQYNYIAVVGKREMENNELNIRVRSPPNMMSSGGEKSKKNACVGTKVESFEQILSRFCNEHHSRLRVPEEGYLDRLSSLEQSLLT